MLLLPASTFVVGVISYTLSLRVFRSLKLLDFPERYGLNRPRIPYPTGMIAVFIFLVFVLPFSTGAAYSMKEWAIVGGVSLLAVTSFVDDRTPLPSWLRLCIQIAVAFIIVAAGSRIYTVTNPFGGFLKLDTLTVQAPLFGQLPVLSTAITVAWLLLTMNAMNWFDGISGQVSVVSMLGFLMLGLLSQFRNGQEEVAVLAYSLSALAAAGMFFDFPPAKMLMGDTGSMFFGLMLGLLGVYQGGKVATIFLALGIPILDALIVITLRMLRGTSPFKGGRDHLHHELMDIAGFNERTIVGILASVGFLLGITALFVSTTEKFLAAFALLFALILTRQWLLRRRASVQRPSPRFEH